MSSSQEPRLWGENESVTRNNDGSVTSSLKVHQWEQGKKEQEKTLLASRELQRKQSKEPASKEEQEQVKTHLCPGSPSLLAFMKIKSDPDPNIHLSLKRQLKKVM